MIYSNQVHCHLCDDKPFSAHRHDFRKCECGSIAVDGGMDYLRRIGEPGGNHTDMSIQVSDELHEDLMVAISDTTKNELGKLCNIARVLRDHGIDMGEKS